MSVEQHVSDKIKTPRGEFRVYDGTWVDFQNEDDTKEWGLWFEYSTDDILYKIMHNYEKQHAIAVIYKSLHESINKSCEMEDIQSVLGRTNKMNNEKFELKFDDAYLPLADYIYDEMSIFRGANGHADYDEKRIPTYEEIIEYFDDRVSREAYDSVVKAIRDNLDNLKYYEGDIELSDRSIVNELNVDMESEDYWNLVDEWCDKFNAEFNTDLRYNGRSYKHVVIEDTIENVLRYNELKDAIDKYQDDFVSYINDKYTTNDPDTTISIKPDSNNVEINVNDNTATGDDGHPIQKGLRGSGNVSIKESIEKQEDVFYKGYTIEHFPYTVKIGDEVDKEYEVNGFIIKSPYYLQSNTGKEKFYLPLYCEDEKGNEINFNSLDDAEQYIDKYIAPEKGKLIIKHGNDTEVHYVINPDELDESLKENKLLKEDHEVNTYKGYNIDLNLDQLDVIKKLGGGKITVEVLKDGKEVYSASGYDDAYAWIDKTVKENQKGFGKDVVDAIIKQLEKDTAYTGKDSLYYYDTFESSFGDGLGINYDVTNGNISLFFYDSGEVGVDSEVVDESATYITDLTDLLDTFTIFLYNPQLTSQIKELAHSHDVLLQISESVSNKKVGGKLLKENKLLKEDHQMETYRGYDLDLNLDLLDTIKEVGEGRITIDISKDGKKVHEANGFADARKWIDEQLEYELKSVMNKLKEIKSAVPEIKLEADAGYWDDVPDNDYAMLHMHWELPNVIFDNITELATTLGIKDDFMYTFPITEDSALEFNFIGYDNIDDSIEKGSGEVYFNIWGINDGANTDFIYDSKRRINLKVTETGEPIYDKEAEKLARETINSWINDICDIIEKKAKSLYEGVKMSNKKEKLKEGVGANEIYTKLKAVCKDDEIDSHASDLYVKVKPETTQIINDYEHANQVTTFKDNITHTKWYEIPFVAPTLKEEYGYYQGEVYCDRIAEYLEDGSEYGVVMTPYGNGEVEWELDINGHGSRDFECDEFFEYLLDNISYPVRDGHLSYMGLDTIIPNGSYNERFDKEDFKHDLEMLDVYDEESFNKFYSDKDYELEFWIDYNTNFDIDEWEELVETEENEEETDNAEYSIYIDKALDDGTFERLADANDLSYRETEDEIFIKGKKSDLEYFLDNINYEYDEDDLTLEESFNGSKVKYEPLEYTDLPITVYGGRRSWETGDYEERETSIDWVYNARIEDVKEVLSDYVSENISDEEIDNYVNEHYNELLTKYYDDVLDYFRGDAIRDAQENNEEEFDIYPDIEESLKEDFTKMGKQIMKDANEIGLSAFYDAYNGVFGFTKEDYDKNQDKIKAWIEKHPDYGVLTQSAKIYKDTELGKSSDGRVYFLSDCGFADDEIGEGDEILIAPNTNKNAVTESLSGSELYKKLKSVCKEDEIDTHRSDLYVKVKPETTKIINDYEYANQVTTFKDNITHTKWYEIPFVAPILKEGKENKIPASVRKLLDLINGDRASKFGYELSPDENKIYIGGVSFDMTKQQYKKLKELGIADNSKELKEGAEGKREKGFEYIIYVAESDETAPIVGKRTTYVEAQNFANEYFKKKKVNCGIEKVPTDKFKVGDDFIGPFDKDYNPIKESLNEDTKIENELKSLPHVFIVIEQEPNVYKLKTTWGKSVREAHSNYLDIRKALEKKYGEENFELNYHIVCNKLIGNEAQCVLEVKFLPTIKESLEERLNVPKLITFIKDAVNGLLNGNANIYRYKLDDKLALFVGWSSGYGKTIRDDVIQNPKNPDEAINYGIKVWTSDNHWVDYDMLNFPYHNNGEVIDISMSADKEDASDDYQYVVNYLSDMYENKLKDLNIDKDGLIIEDENLKENLSDKTFDCKSVAEAQNKLKELGIDFDQKKIAAGSGDVHFIKDKEKVAIFSPNRQKLYVFEKPVKVNESVDKKDVFTAEEQETYNIDKDGYAINGYDHFVRCKMCHEPVIEDEVRYETDLGELCPHCVSALKSRGEELNFEDDIELDKSLKENYDDSTKLLRDQGYINSTQKVVDIDDDTFVLYDIENNQYTKLDLKSGKETFVRSGDLEESFNESYDATAKKIYKLFDAYMREKNGGKYFTYTDYGVHPDFIADGGIYFTLSWDGNNVTEDDVIKELEHKIPYGLEFSDGGSNKFDHSLFVTASDKLCKLIESKTDYAKPVKLKKFKGYKKGELGTFQTFNPNSGDMKINNAFFNMSMGSSPAGEVSSVGAADGSVGAVSGGVAEGLSDNGVKSLKDYVEKQKSEYDETKDNIPFEEENLIKVIKEYAGMMGKFTSEDKDYIEKELNLPLDEILDLCFGYNEDKDDMSEVSNIVKECIVPISEGKISELDIDIKNAGGRDKFIEEKQRELNDLQDYLIYLNSQAMKEIGRGGNFDSQAEIDETVDETSDKINEIKIQIELAKTLEK